MRDILKPYSGTPSGTDVSLPIKRYFDDFLVRGKDSKPWNVVTTRKLIVSFSYL
jgi:hypothetical protein